MIDFNELLKPAGTANDVAVIESLKGSDFPVVLYGATVDVADQIVKKLAANHIRIKLVAFDEESPVMTDSTILLKETEKVHVEDLDQKLPGYHVVLGFVKAYGHIGRVSAKFKNARTVSYLSEIFDMEIITPSFVQENKMFLKDLYDDLQDRQSKDSLAAYLLSKIRQDMKYLPPIFDKIQYFPQGMFEFTDHESYFDCGAFTGDTIAEFLKASGGVYRHIWAAEPDRSNYRQLMQYIEDRKLSNIDVVNKGIYGYAGKLPFQEEGSMLSMISEGSDRYIEVDTIDRIAAGNPVTYIKMDVEGAELMALKGAEQTIRKYKPVLGISIYHKVRDLIDIPMYIKEIAPEYKFYFRVHKKLAIDTVLYGVVK
ncbi:MAG: FkbM family methyltransferase [Tannerella sp.]|jgi:FkbM family methyltransferase|nr:FkbM family methyltransferase [Tannerella sp.]